MNDEKVKKYNVVIRVYEDTVLDRQKEYASDTEEAIRQAFIWISEDGIYLERLEEVNQ